MPRTRTYKAETPNWTAYYATRDASPPLPDSPALLKQIVNKLLARIDSMQPGLADNLSNYIIKDIAMIERAQRLRPDWSTLEQMSDTALIDIVEKDLTPGNHDSLAIAIQLERTGKYLREISFSTDPDFPAERLSILKEIHPILLERLRPIFCRCRPNRDFFDKDGRPLFLPRNLRHPRTIQGWAYRLVAHYHCLSDQTLRSLAKPSRWAWARGIGTQSVGNNSPGLLPATPSARTIAG